MSRGYDGENWHAQRETEEDGDCGVDEDDFAELRERLEGGLRERDSGHNGGQGAGHNGRPDVPDGRKGPPPPHGAAVLQTNNMAARR